MRLLNVGFRVANVLPSREVGFLASSILAVLKTLREWSGIKWICIHLIGIIILARVFIISLPSPSWHHGIAWHASYTRSASLLLFIVWLGSSHCLQHRRHIHTSITLVVVVDRHRQTLTIDHAISINRNLNRHGWSSSSVFCSYRGLSSIHLQTLRSHFFTS